MRPPIGLHSWLAACSRKEAGCVFEALDGRSSTFAPLVLETGVAKYHLSSAGNTAGLDVLRRHTQNYFAMRSRGLQQILNIQMKSS